jgi:hypothetical protein
LDRLLDVLLDAVVHVAPDLVAELVRLGLSAQHQQVLEGLAGHHFLTGYFDCFVRGQHVLVVLGLVCGDAVFG